MGEERSVEDDLVLLLEACTAALDERVLAAVRDAAGGRVRFADGYVFQHLLVGPCSVSDLARKLGVSQQAASKHVADLAERGLVLRRRDPDDGRARVIVLSARGRRAVEAGREARAQIAREVEELLGARRTKALLGALGAISAEAGAADAMRERRLRPESAR